MSLQLVSILINLDLSMKFGQSQLSIWHTLDSKTSQIWWLVNIEYKHLKWWLLYYFFYLILFDVFVPTSPIIFGQVVWPSNILKCQFIPRSENAMCISRGVVEADQGACATHNLGAYSLNLLKMAPPKFFWLRIDNADNVKTCRVWVCGLSASNGGSFGSFVYVFISLCT